MSKNLSITAFIFLFIYTIMSCNSESSKENYSSQSTLPDIIDFNFHVKPILSDKCFKCHGPDVNICRPVIKEDFVYLATIWSGTSSAGAGFVSILDKNNQVISAPGGIEPTYTDGKLHQMHQSLKVFHHPHDVCIDKDDNLYVAQWNSGQTYPIKLIRV